MILIGLERIALQGRLWLQAYFKLQARAAEETELEPDPGYLHLYVKDTDDGTRLYFRDDGGNEYQILAGAGTTSIASGRQAVAATDTEAIVTHGFTNALAIIMSLNTTWNAGGPYISAQDDTTFTATFPTEAPAEGGTLHWAVMLP